MLTTYIVLGLSALLFIISWFATGVVPFMAFGAMFVVIVGFIGISLHYDDSSAKRTVYLLTSTGTSLLLFWEFVTTFVMGSHLNETTTSLINDTNNLRGSIFPLNGDGALGVLGNYFYRFFDYAGTIIGQMNILVLFFFLLIIAHIAVGYVLAFMIKHKNLAI
jgi:uncharacterized protein (UPF0333 family)